MVAGPNEDVPRVRALGRYELFTKLGSGGMAEVHLARQRGLKRFRKLVVVKTVHPQLAKDERFIDLLLEEARISALLKHPRVVDIYDVSEEGGTVFIAMEYLPGQSITQIIRAGRKDKKLDVLSAARIIGDAAEGLDAAHNLKALTGERLELVHRDVSPGNIIVLYSGDVKLVDFGVAKAKDHLTSAAIGKFAGKLGYAAPEQLRNEPPDRRSDIFSLGVVLWELLCHRRLFLAKSRDQALELTSSGKAPKPSSIRDDVPQALDDLCLKALAPDPGDRFQTAKEMLEAIDQMLFDEGFRRESDSIGCYMDDVFHEERTDTELLVRQAAEATNQISIASLADEDAPTAIDVALPEKIAAVLREEAARDEAAKLAASEKDTDVQDVDSDALMVGAAGTAPGAGTPLWTRARGMFAVGQPWRRPTIVAITTVVGVVLAVVVWKVAMSGASGTQTSSSASAVPSVADSDASVRVSSDAAVANTAVADAGATATTAGSDAGLESAAASGHKEHGGAREAKAALAAKAREAKKAVREAKAARAAKALEKKEAREAKKAREAEAKAARAQAKEEAKEERKRAREKARVKYLEGMREVKAGRFSVAQARFSESIRADSRYAPPHRGLGIVYQLQGAKKAAARELRRYLRMRPRAKDAKLIGERLKKLEGS